MLGLKAVLLIGYTIWLCMCIKRWPHRHCLIRITAALLFVVLFTLVRPGFPERKSIVTPFQAFAAIWSSNWRQHGRYVFRAVVGNIILFIPLGLALPCEKRSRLIYTIPVIVSITVEILQYAVSIGTFEIDDIICNSIGGLTGCELRKRIAGSGNGSFWMIGVYVSFLALVCFRSIVFN